MANRIDGIVSGLDTESLIKAMVSGQQAQIDRLKQKNTSLSWKQDRYKDLYKKIEDFRIKAFSYRLDTATRIKTASSNNTTLVDAKATPDALVGVHTIKVHSLATYAQIGSSAALGSATDKSSISSQFGGTYTGTFDLKLNGKTITVDTSKSINEFIKQVNASDAGVSASYDATLDRVFFSTTKTGSDAKIDFSATTDAAGVAFLENGLKLPRNTGGDISYAGTDAKFDLDGITGLEQKTNEFTISGLTYQLKEADPTKTITINVDKDTQGIVDSVKGFVDAYNELLDEINGAIYEKKVSAYKPLTDEQKQSMTAEQIKSWEEQAKKGIVARDPMLLNIVSNMRQMVYSTVGGISSYVVGSSKVTLNSLHAIGITTQDYSTNGRLKIDEDKLKGALEVDPDCVSKIFKGVVPETDGIRQSDRGMIPKLYDSLKQAMDKIDAQAGATKGSADDSTAINKQIINNNKAINKKIDFMNKQIQTYYKQFDAMEKLMQQMQQQQQSLAGFFQ